MSGSDPKESVDRLVPYPMLKITAGPFPQVLATRVFGQDIATYYGPFLSRTAVRILIDRLNRLFRMRSCLIDLDGSFAAPCTMYFSGRCLAPCVADICDADEYSRSTAIVDAFLRNDRERVRNLIQGLIQDLAAATDFENAARWRDTLRAVQDIWSDPLLNVWLDDAVDTIFVENEGSDLSIVVITSRGRRILGTPVGTFGSAAEIRGELERFYQRYRPREVRLTGALDQVKELKEVFAELLPNSGIRRVSTPALGVTTLRAYQRLRASMPSASPARSRIAEPLDELKALFNLNAAPRHIEAFDVAHISGSDFAAANAVWSNGRIRTDLAGIWVMDDVGSEPAALRRLLSLRVSDRSRPMDLLIIDGGPAQLSTAVEALRELGLECPVGAAVKPRGRHHEVSHFLCGNKTRIDFDPRSSAMSMLKLLRDEAHDSANRAHRQIRETRHAYRLFEILPSVPHRQRKIALNEFGSVGAIAEASEEQLISLLGDTLGRIAAEDVDRYLAGGAPPVGPFVVPTFLIDPNGRADDLRPIERRA